MNAVTSRRWLPLFLLAAALSACGTETPSEAVVVNDYGAAASDGSFAGEVTIYRAWYATTLFREPLGPGEQSAPQRTVPGKARAYVVLAVGWDPTSSAPPSSFVAAMSKSAFDVDRGGTLRITVSDDSFTGRCDGAEPLSQKDADFITQRIFPAEFAGLDYDAATCTAGPSVAPDAGVKRRD